MSSPDPEYVRHTIPLIFDVPAARVSASSEQVADGLNIVTTLIMDTIAENKRIQATLRRYGIEWGWGQGTWEE